MRRGTLIALIFGVPLGVWGAARAHDHAPPIRCVDWCEDDNCKCWEKCKGQGLIPPNDCTVACNAIYEDCEKSCDGAGS